MESKTTRGDQTAYSHMQISSQFMKPSSPLNQPHPNYITSPPCVSIGCTMKGVGSLHSSETTLHLLQHSYLRPLIHTTQNFKWLRYTLTTQNISQLQTCIYFLETAHPYTTKQLTRVYNTAYGTSQTFHTGDANTHSTLWHSYTDDHKGQLIAEVTSNSEHITLNTNTPNGVLNTTLQQTSSLDITTVFFTLYNCTSWTTQHALLSDRLPIITTMNMRHDYIPQQTRRTFSNCKKDDCTQSTEDTESAFAQTTIPNNLHTANISFTNIILMADKHNIPTCKMYSNGRVLSYHICKITQRNNMVNGKPVIQLLNS